MTKALAEAPISLPADLEALSRQAVKESSRGNANEAERLHRQVLELSESVVASALANVGAACERQGRFLEAIDSYQKSRALIAKIGDEAKLQAIDERIKNAKALSVEKFDKDVLSQFDESLNALA